MISVKLKMDEGASIPFYATPGASGFDISSMEDYIIFPGETVLVKTGLYFDIPEGYELQIRPRSGVSFKTGLRVANSPGTIDADYRGEVKVIMCNQGSNIEKISKGDRIAQGVFAEVPKATFILDEQLSETERGAGGFGSTGKN
jgi:dUTP pyrophosphatase